MDVLDVEYGDANEEVKRESTEEVYGRSGGGCAEVGVTEEDAGDSKRCGQIRLSSPKGSS